MTFPWEIRGESEEMTIPLKFHQALYGMAGELFPSAQCLEFHQEREKNDLTAGFLDQFDRGTGRASGGQYIVVDEYPVAGDDGIGVDLEGVGAVFQIVRNGKGGERQFAFFTDRDVPYPQTVRDERAEKETPGLDGGNFGDAQALCLVAQLVECLVRGARVEQQRGYVAKGHARLGEILDIADVMAKVCLHVSFFYRLDCVGLFGFQCFCLILLLSVPVWSIPFLPPVPVLPVPRVSGREGRLNGGTSGRAGRNRPG